MKPFSRKPSARYLWISVLCAAPIWAGAAPAPQTWVLLNRETGCEPLSELHADYPMLQGIQQPRPMWLALRKHYPDVVLQPFVDVLAQERKANPTISPEEKAFFRAFTKTNAYVISSKAQHIEWSLVTKALCDRLMQGPTTG